MDDWNSWSADGNGSCSRVRGAASRTRRPVHPFNPQPYGDVYVMGADGSDVRMPTDDQFEEGTPDWVPQSRAGSKD